MVPPPLRSSLMNAVVLLPNPGLAMRCSPDRYFPSIVLWTHPGTRSDTVAKPRSVRDPHRLLSYPFVRLLTFVCQRHGRGELNVTGMDGLYHKLLVGMLIYFTRLVSNFNRTSSLNIRSIYIFLHSSFYSCTFM